MLSTQALWWLALPVLLLPVWWHRQRRQRVKAELLATARFLPSSAPEQLRVWQWDDRILLLVRCLLLLALIAWLAVTVFPWRGDSVLLDAGADKTWAEQQIKDAGFGAAPRIDLPSDALSWLRENEIEWRSGARLLIVAGAGKVGMPARVSHFSHRVELRIKPEATGLAAAKPVAPTEHHIVLSSSAAHAQAWHALFAAFDVAGGGKDRYIVTDTPDSKTELIVWDTPDAPPPAWHAPLWWFAPNQTPPELAGAPSVHINGLTLKYTDSARGRLWSWSTWPAQDADTARAAFDMWQALAHAAPAYAAPAQAFPVGRNVIVGAAPASWLALALLALFLLERILTHARRH